MDDELDLADSAGHTMIDIDAARAADRAESDAADQDRRPAED